MLDPNEEEKHDQNNISDIANNQTFLHAQIN